jgi:hypothetical protein
VNCEKLEIQKRMLLGQNRLANRDGDSAQTKQTADLAGDHSRRQLAIERMLSIGSIRFEQLLARLSLTLTTLVPSIALLLLPTQIKITSHSFRERDCV